MTRRSLQARGWWLVLLCTAVVTFPIRAEVTSPTPPFSVSIHHVAPVSVPSAARKAIAETLEYFDSEQAMDGVEFDLNADGRPEAIVRSAQSLGGNGGCPWVIIDVQSGKQLGELFGYPLYVRAERHNGYQVLATFSHGGGGLGTVIVYHFEAGTCRVDSRLLLEGARLDEVSNTTLCVPEWRPDTREMISARTCDAR